MKHYNWSTETRMKNLALTEVVPDEIYMFGHGKEMFPVRFVCDKTQGWLRGQVLVRGFDTGYNGFKAFATLEPVLGGRHLDVLVYRRAFSDPWVYNNTGYEKLIHVHEKEVRDLLDKHVAAATLRIQDLRATITAAEQEIERLKLVKV